MLKTRFNAPMAVTACFAGSVLAGSEQPAAPGFLPPANVPVALAEGFATTHVIAKLRPGIQPAEGIGGRMSFDIGPSANAEHPPTPQQRALLRAASRAAGERLAERGATRIAKAVPSEPASTELARDLGLDRYFRIEVPAGSDTAALVDELRVWDVLFESVELDGLGGVAAMPPNDPEFPLQYGLHNTGQNVDGQFGVAGADIGALAAWNLTKGCDDIVIAVLDSGVQPHVDLAGRLLPGWNVATDPHSDDWAPSSDCNSHGTHVAGIIAANVNNSIGVAGVTWQSKILPVVVLDGCTGNQGNLAAGIIWATDAGADVINMSLQYGPTGSSLLHSAVQYAYNSGVVLVASAGNNDSFNVCNGSTCVAFPARWPEVIAVAGTTNQDQKWGTICGSGSNCGPELSVAAASHRVRSITGVNTTGYKNGTSFAAPHVAGAAALMLSLDPGLAPDDVRIILEATAHDLGTPGHNEMFGYGRINAHAALLGVVGPIPGDLTGDCDVNVFDLLELLKSWGPCSGCSPADCPADLDGNCLVNVFDLLGLLQNWGNHCIPCAP